MLDDERQQLLPPPPKNCAAWSIRCERCCLAIVPICAAAMIISGATVLMLLFGPRPQ